MLATWITFGIGFLFWVVAARLYSEKDVGIATVLTSSITLIVALSRMGLDSSQIRFFPDYDKGKIFNTSVIISTVFSLLIGTFFVLNINVFSPQLIFLKLNNFILFSLYLAANSILTVILNTFTAMRKTEFISLCGIITGSRLLLLFPLVSFEAMGVFGAFGISFILTILLSIFILIKFDIRPAFEIDIKFLKESFHFSLGNYASALLANSPTWILPIIVFNILGSKEAAYYYIAYSIASILIVIPSAISMQLFVECSHGRSLRKVVSTSMIMTFSVLIPCAAVMTICSGWLLTAVGKDYIVGLETLRFMILSVFFMAIVYICQSIARVQKKNNVLVFIGGATFVSIIISSYYFIPKFGLVGAGYALLVGYGLVAFISILIMKKDFRVSYNPASSSLEVVN
jgi:O-antigen/teichoic acid export membrane protein